MFAESYTSAAPVLIAGGSDAALARAERTVEGYGLRVADKILIENAPERMDRQARASALWVELDEGGGDRLDALLSRLGSDVSDGRFPAVVAAPAGLVDLLAAQLPDEVQLVIDGSDAERASALAIAVSGLLGAHRLSDVAAEQNTARLRQLSDEVSRIAATLARLSSAPAIGFANAPQQPSAEVPDVSIDTVRMVIRARRLRSRYFAEDLFADPAWDMLLDLLQAELAQLRVPVSSLCIAAAVPATTALRWLKGMTEQGLFVRRADPHDARRVFVELAPQTSASMRRYFADVGKVTVA
ncbi:MAG: MarR family winged helix-turn-helix transcriptional regulator [Pseudomonadota bacterium]|nr:winged helix-turn-helix transcriptional regulator [Sphingomonas sp.]MDQ3478612.1 MarR family winged helix-turn-helix transcriptional regulator [Pseudomonadota bacterium]